MFVFLQSKTINNTNMYTVYNDINKPYIEMAMSLSAMTHYGVYLFETKSGKVVYMDDSAMQFLNLKKGDMKESGFTLVKGAIRDDEKSLTESFIADIRTRRSMMPKNKTEKALFYINHHVKNSNVMLSHKLSLLDLDAKGESRLLLGTVTSSIYKLDPVITFKTTGSDNVYQFEPTEKKWNKLTPVSLTEHEKTMLRLTMQGYSLNEIGKIMFKSTESVKYYRRQVFRKLGVKNISEAIAYAINFCLI